MSLKKHEGITIVAKTAALSAEAIATRQVERIVGVSKIPLTEFSQSAL